MRSDLIVRDITRSNKNIVPFPISDGDTQLERGRLLKQSQDNIFNSEPGAATANEEET